MESEKKATTTTPSITFRSDDVQCFLSNFFATPITYSCYIYKSAEHLFQAAICSERKDRNKIRSIDSPKTAKILGRFMKKRSNWGDEELTKVMYKILRLKFSKPWLRRLLLETGDAELIHINYWHDTFFGVCTCTHHKRMGKNLLGILLMKLRAKIKNKKNVNVFNSQ